MKRRRNPLKKKLPLQLQELVPSMKVSRLLRSHNTWFETFYSYERWKNSRMDLCVYTGPTKGITLPAPLVEEVLTLFPSWKLIHQDGAYHLTFNYDPQTRKYSVAWQHPSRGNLVEAESDVLSEALTLLVIAMIEKKIDFLQFTSANPS